MAYAICIFSFLLTLVLSRYFIRYASKRNILDYPSDRGSHEKPMPRGGGIVFVIVITALLLGTYYLNDANSVLSSSQLLPVLIGGLVIAIVGYLDDCRGVSQINRLLVHLITFTVVLSFFTLPVNEDPYIYWPIFALTVIASSWILNLYNFMDGIDGIAATEGVFVLVSAAILIYMTSYDERIITILLCTAGALLGFLWFNWPPSKLFMGDSGSGFIGYMLAFMVFSTWATGLMKPQVWAILLGFFIFDATVTLSRRILTGEPFYKAHKEHIYQRLARKWRSHKAVTLLVLVIDVFWLLPMAWIAIGNQELDLVILVVSYVPLGVIYLWVDRANKKSLHL